MVDPSIAAFRGVAPPDPAVAALAGMPRPAFNAALGDDKLKSAILAAQSEAEKRHRIQSTPSFVIGGRTVAGAMSYDAFLKQIEQAA